MRQYVFGFVVLTLLAAVIAVPAAAGPVGADDAVDTAALSMTTETVENDAQSAGANASTPNSTATDVAPGQRLAGVVGAHRAEIEGEMEERSFRVRISNASNETKADVVATEVNQLRERVRELQERRQRLLEAKTNGTLTQGEFRARMTVIVAETQTVRRVLNASDQVARELPEPALERKGVDPREIRRLQNETGEMSGPEAAAIARSVVDDDVGKRMKDSGRGEDERPEHAQAGEPERGNQSEGNQTTQSDRGENPDASDSNSGNSSTEPEQNSRGNPDERSRRESAGQGNDKSDHSQSNDRQNQSTDGQNQSSDGSPSSRDKSDPGQGDAKANKGQENGNNSEGQAENGQDKNNAGGADSDNGQNAGQDGRSDANGNGGQGNTPDGEQNGNGNGGSDSTPP